MTQTQSVPNRIYTPPPDAVVILDEYSSNPAVGVPARSGRQILGVGATDTVSAPFALSTKYVTISASSNISVRVSLGTSSAGQAIYETVRVPSGGGGGYTIITQLAANSPFLGILSGMPLTAVDRASVNPPVFQTSITQAVGPGQRVFIQLVASY